MGTICHESGYHYQLPEDMGDDGKETIRLCPLKTGMFHFHPSCLQDCRDYVEGHAPPLEYDGDIGPFHFFSYPYL